MIGSEDVAAALAHRQARKEKRLSSGRFLPPTEVAKLGIGVDRWTLKGEVHREMFAEIQKSEDVHHAVRMLSCEHVPYIVLVQQVANWQHRMVIQLRGEYVRAFADDVHTGTCSLLLASAGGAEGMLADLPIEVRCAMPRAETIQPATGDPRTALSNFMRVTEKMLQPAALNDAGLPAAQDVCVSTVLPDEVYAAAEAMADKLLGRKPS